MVSSTSHARSHPDSTGVVDGLFGTPLHAADLALTLAISVTLFLFWHGPLWKAAPGQVHMDRIVVSYLFVIPLVAGLLAFRGFGWDHLAVGVAMVWSVKMILTVLLYHGLAPSIRPRLVAAPIPTGSGTPDSYAIVDVPSPTVITGQVLGFDGSPVADAAVSLCGITEGLRPMLRRGSTAITLVEGADGIRPSVGTATLGDELAIEGDRQGLHVLQGKMGNRSVLNLAAPPGARPSETLRSPGVVRLACTAHPAHQAWIHVFLHPYHTVTDADGRFSIPGVPPGRHTVCASPGANPGDVVGQGSVDATGGTSAPIAVHLGAS